MTRLQSIKGKTPSGTITVPGDKSISHRALMLSALAMGRSTVQGLLEGEDVLATAAAMRQMGATINRIDNGIWQVDGVGVGGLLPPVEKIEMGNSGTSTRLLMGLIATHGIEATMVGDASLQSRPMGRVTIPLSQMGAKFVGQDGKLPMTIYGTQQSQPIHYATPMASAQVKSTVLLAGLNTAGITNVTEKTATRDHSERMLESMGANINTQANNDGSFTITLVGQPDLKPTNITVPGDISSAAFPLTLAAMTPGADITIKNVGVNPLRTGIICGLRAMGASVTLTNERLVANEPVADIRVEGTRLNAITDIGADASTMIDEFPVLFVAASTANGTTKLRGLAELRVKESDRLAVMAEGLAANGIDITLHDDGIDIVGASGDVIGGGTIKSYLDHRIAMSFAVLGQAAEKPVTIDDASPINTSFPDFVALMTSLGCQFREG